MLKNNIKVSVILPSLNVNKYISDCLTSVVNQSLKEIEIICIDAGSDDGTLEILKNYVETDSRIKLLHSDIKSYGHQLNLAINISSGDYIGIVETDDFIDEKMYETLYNLTDNGNCDIAKVNFFHFYDSNPPKIKQDVSKNKLPLNKKFTVYQNANFLTGHPSIWAAIYKKSFLKENNIKFLEASGGGWVDNLFLHQTALSAKSIVYSNNAYYYYRESNPDSSTNKMKDLTLPMRRMFDILDILDEYSCNDENIIIEIYIRIFYHIKKLLIEDFRNQKYDVWDCLKKVLNRLDVNIIEKYMSLINKLIYYILTSSSNVDSFSTKILIIFVKFASKIGLM